MCINCLWYIHAVHWFFNVTKTKCRISGLRTILSTIFYIGLILLNETNTMFKFNIFIKFHKGPLWNLRLLNFKYYIPFFVGKMFLRKYMILFKFWSTISAIAVQTFHPVDLQGGRFFYLNFSNFRGSKNKLNSIYISTSSQSIMNSMSGSFVHDTHLLHCHINQ